MNKTNSIRPGIVIRDDYWDEITIYPTNFEYLLAFAIKGCQWAIDMLPEAVANHTQEETLKSFGSGI